MPGLAVAQAESELFEGASARIEQHRQADARVQVVDAQGKPVPGAKVEVSQTKHAFLFGSNIFLWGKAGTPEGEQLYRGRFKDVFNFATIPFYWPAYENTQGKTDAEDRLAVAAWCQSEGIKTKGHPLAWNYFEPRWLPSDPDEVFALQLARIDRDAALFQGKIEVWDVVNEATHFERGELQKQAPRLTQAWEKAGRVPFVLECFKHARAADPTATLLINDYRTDPPYARLIDDLIAANGGMRPFDAIGLQSHMHDGAWSNERVWEVCERFARFGVPLHFTELTILSGELGHEIAKRENSPWPSTPEGEARQADEVERIYTMIFSHPAVEAITWWDFSDRRAWQRAPAGFLRNDLSPKPAYERLQQLVKERWWTRVEGEADEQGQYRLRGFLGDYQVKVSTSGHTVEKTFQIARGQENTVTVSLP